MFVPDDIVCQVETFFQTFSLKAPIDFYTFLYFILNGPYLVVIYRVNDDMIKSLSVSNYLFHCVPILVLSSFTFLRSRSNSEITLCYKLADPLKGIFLWKQFIILPALREK